MTVSSANPPDRRGPDWDKALYEASEWSVYLDEEPDDATLRACFEHWVGGNPLHRDAWTHINHVTGVIAQTKGLAFFLAPKAESSAIQSRPSFQPGRRTFVAAAAAAAIAWIAGPQVILHATADHITGTAEERVIAFDDGSTVRLAPGSAVKLAYSHDERRLNLLAGEAYFEVAPNPSRPFRVAAKSTTVTVLGTGFNVRLGADGQDIAVKHGRVRVENPDGKPPANAVLTAGQWLHVGGTGAAVAGEMSPTSVGSWSGHTLVAIDRPLSEVIADVRRYYGGAIVLTSGRLGSASVTGSYDLSDPATAIGSIVKPHGGVVRRISPWLIIISES